MRVFVVGATGALGRRIVPRLLAQGHEVTAAGRDADRLHQLAALGATPAPCDLFDAAAIHRAMRGHDAVINVATRVPSPTRMLLPGAWRAMDRVRTEGAAIVADAVIANKVGRLVQESFAPTYPDAGDRWITERTAIAPAHYNRSVAAAESSALRVVKAGATAVILRFGMLYGPGDPFAEQVFGSIRKGWSPFLGRPDGYLPLVTHDDAAAAAVAALAAPSGFYNIVDDEPMTREDLASSLATMLGVKPPRSMPLWVGRLAGSLGETLGRSLRISNRKFREATGWVPETPSAAVGFRHALEAATGRGSAHA